MPMEWLRTSPVSLRLLPRQLSHPVLAQWSFLGTTAEAYFSPLCFLPCKLRCITITHWELLGSEFSHLPHLSSPPSSVASTDVIRSFLCLHSSIHKICFSRREPRTKSYLGALESSWSDKLNRHELISKLWAWFLKWLQVHLPNCVITLARVFHVTQKDIIKTLLYTIWKPKYTLPNCISLI